MSAHEAAVEVVAQAIKQAVAESRDMAEAAVAAVAALDAAGPLATEQEFADFDALHDHLLALNEAGEPPDVSGYNRAGQPIIAWLTEEGGDSTWPLGLTLGGDDGAQPTPVPSDMKDLYYPVRVSRRVTAWTEASA